LDAIAVTIVGWLVVIVGCHENLSVIQMQGWHPDLYGDEI
jgi:hypothetical protein